LLPVTEEVVTEPLAEKPKAKETSREAFGDLMNKKKAQTETFSTHIKET